MAKLMIPYGHPADPAAFEDHDPDRPMPYTVEQADGDNIRQPAALRPRHNWAICVASVPPLAHIPAAPVRRYGAGWPGRSSSSWHAWCTGTPARLAAARM